MQTRYVVAAFALLGALIYLSIRHVPSSQPTLTTTHTPIETRGNNVPGNSAPSAVAPSTVASLPQAQAPATVAAVPATAHLPSPPERKIEPIHIGELHRQALEKFKAFTGGRDEITPLHDALAAESRDPQWSYDMEERLNQFLVSRGAELGIEAPVVACRTSGCEIQLITYKRPPAFDQLIGALGKEPWFNLTTTQQARVPVASDAVVAGLFFKRP
jgi:hypothetical protein